MEGLVTDKDKFLGKVERANPNVIILGYRHEIQFGDFHDFPNKYFYNAPNPNTIPWVLEKKGFIGEFLDCYNVTTLTISKPTKGIYKLENCILLCHGLATEYGMVKTLMEDFLDKKNLANKEQTRVMILTGGHGSLEDKQGNLLPVGGISCFTQKELLYYKFYSSICS